MPRSEELIAAYRRLAEGRCLPEELRSLARKEVEGLLEMQRRLGITFPVEGQLLWHDLLRPFSDLLGGLEPGPLTRWYDNNLFYKMPIISSNLVRRDSILDKYLFLDVVGGLEWKLILPEPYTFHTLSRNQAYADASDLVLDFAGVLSEELKSLGGSAPRLVQLSAPSLGQRPLSLDEIELVEESIRVLRRGFNGFIMVHIFFHNAANAIPWIFDTGVDIVGIDLFSTSLEAIKGYSFEGAVAVGCIDARNSYLESIGEVEAAVRSVVDSLEANSYHLTTNADLEYLPRRVSEAKLERLATAFKQLGGNDKN